MAEQNGSGDAVADFIDDGILGILIVTPIKFSFGQVVGTPEALTAVAEAGQSASTYLARHGSGDWGELDPEDQKANDFALNNDERLLSSYVLPTGTKLWIITEWDRSQTTLLLPSEY